MDNRQQYLPKFTPSFAYCHDREAVVICLLPIDFLPFMYNFID